MEWIAGHFNADAEAFLAFFRRLGRVGRREAVWQGGGRFSGGFRCPPPPAIQPDSTLLSWGISGLDARWLHRLEACATGNLIK